MAATLVTPVQISSTTISGSPYIIILGSDNCLYALDLTTTTNKQLNTTYTRLPPIYNDGTAYAPVKDGAGAIQPDVTDLIYTVANK